MSPAIFPCTGRRLCHQCSPPVATKYHSAPQCLRPTAEQGGHISLNQGYMPREGNATDIFYKDKFHSENTSHLTLMWLLSRVNQVVFLQVGKLCKALVASLTLERPFSTVDSQVDLGRRRAC